MKSNSANVLNDSMPQMDPSDFDYVLMLYKQCIDFFAAPFLYPQEFKTFILNYKKPSENPLPTPFPILNEQFNDLFVQSANQVVVSELPHMLIKDRGSIPPAIIYLVVNGDKTKIISKAEEIKNKYQRALISDDGVLNGQMENFKAFLNNYPNFIDFLFAENNVIEFTNQAIEWEKFLIKDNLHYLKKILDRLTETEKERLDELIKKFDVMTSSVKFVRSVNRIYLGELLFEKLLKSNLEKYSLVDEHVSAEKMLYDLIKDNDLREKVNNEIKEYIGKLSECDCKAAESKLNMIIQFYLSNLKSLKLLKLNVVSSVNEHGLFRLVQPKAIRPLSANSPSANIVSKDLSSYIDRHFTDEIERKKIIEVLQNDANVNFVLSTFVTWFNATSSDYSYRDYLEQFMKCALTACLSSEYQRMIVDEYHKLKTELETLPDDAQLLKLLESTYHLRITMLEQTANSRLKPYQ